MTWACDAVILAAGASQRMGTPKQLLAFEGQSLLRRIAREAVASRCRKTLVVVGSSADLSAGQVTGLGVGVVLNNGWRSGMASSIREGVAAARELGADAVLILTADQPLVSRRLIDRILKAAQAGKKGILGCRYGEVTGVPALFRKKYFPDLLELEGDRGARSVLQKYPKDVGTIPFPQGRFDIDTEDDYQKLLELGLVRNRGKTQFKN